MIKSIKFNKNFDKFIYIFLLLSPVLDALTSIFVRNTDLPFSIGTIIRGVFLLLIIIWIRYNEKNKKILIFFMLYVLLALLYYFSINKSGIYNEMNNIMQIFYLPIIMLFFCRYNNEKIDDKLIVKIYLLYLNLIIIPFLFNIGYNLTESYSNKIGYFGLFIGGNEISAIIVGLSPIVLTYVNKSKSYILKLVTYIELAFVMYLVGTKTLFIGIILTLLYLYYRHLRYAYVVMNKKKNDFINVIVILLVIGFVVAIPFSPMMKNIKTTLNYYEINNLKDIIKLKNIDNVIFSRRLSNLNNVSKEFFKGTSETIIYGLGINNVSKINVIEIDLFDIFFSIGLFGSFIYFLLILYTSRFNELKNDKAYSCTLFILMSIFTGHVLIKPMVSIYIGLLYLLTKNSRVIEKKKILLVSNMYPSEQSKHYGVFVKNTKELLEKNNFYVDIVVMSKQSKKLNKLLSYIRLHLETIYKGIFGNYDYIYVHFISHSSLGAVFVKKTSKDIKFVLNAHGNDVVKDFDFEEKNIKRSKKYLKYADSVVVPSKYFKKVMIDDYNVSEEKIFIYPSGGVNTNLFINIDKKEAKKEVGLDNKYSYIGYVSRLDKNKGYDVFLKAIKYMIDNKLIKNERFLVIGSGAEENIFNELVKELDLKDYLEIRNMVSPEELVYIYNSLDIFVFPTYRKSESLGLVGLEAMSCETLLIASKNYGPTDYVINNKNGLFFKPNDEIDLVNAITKMKNLNNEEIKKMKKKERETAIKYDIKNTEDLILEVFK